MASDNVDDARQIVRQLKTEFDHVHLSTNPEQAVEDFETLRPAVLVLAFDTLDKAQRYYLGLYRLGKAAQQHTHRTVILCQKDEVRAVCDLCKKDYFDDYVLYWPHSYDGSRLSMSIWIACREMAALPADLPRVAELLTHTRRLDDLEAMLGSELADTEHQLDAARKAMARADREITSAIDEFSRRLVGCAAADAVDGQATQVLASEIEQFKSQQIAQVRSVGAGSIETLNTWVKGFKNRIEPLLASARVLTDKMRLIRSVVMVVDDDEFARELVGRMLDPKTYEVLYAAESTEALKKLRRVRPDVILMDITLPGLDGLSLTQLLKASPQLSDIPIIMMTGDSRRETLVKSREIGAASFVVKPFTRESLTLKLETLFPR